MKKEVVKLNHNNVDDAIQMMLELWPESTWEDELSFCEDIIRGNKYDLFLLKTDEIYVGFLLLSLRTDWVEGAENFPIAYIEGIYIRSQYKRRGFGRFLVQKAEEWARSKGSDQLGSDVEIGNRASIEFHNNMGFKEENRVICYMKNLK